MDITPIIPEGQKIITSYGPEGFTISKQLYTGSVLVLPQKVIPWPVSTWNSEALASLKALLAAEEKIEILLIGGGKQHLLLQGMERQQLRQHVVNIDSMNTGAACRTYNILLAEGRKVAAALIAG